MPELRVVTASQAGLTGNDIVRICLERILELGGEAQMSDLYAPIEARMPRARLSEAGQAYIRHRVNQTAVSAGLIEPHDPDRPGWRITPEGRESARQGPCLEAVVRVATGRQEQSATNAASGLAFERYVLELLKLMYRRYAWYHQGVHRREQRGIDLLGSRLGDEQTGPRTVGAQVKHHGDGRSLAPAEWRSFLAGVAARRLDQALFVTTGRLTGEQRREAHEAEVIVIEGRDEVTRIAAEFGQGRFELLDEPMDEVELG